MGEPLTLDDDDDTDSQPFEELLTISDKSALIPQEEPAVQSWEELRTVCWIFVILVPLNNNYLLLYMYTGVDRAE